MTEQRMSAWVERLDQMNTKIESQPSTASFGKMARRLRDIEVRLERGVGRRNINVLCGEASVQYAISDELAVLARSVLRSLAAYEVARGRPEITPEVFCMSGLQNLREIVKRDPPQDEMRATIIGSARLALLRLYDDLILRRYQQSDEPQIFYAEKETLPIWPSDEYWLMLSEDGDVPQVSLWVGE